MHAAPVVYARTPNLRMVVGAVAAPVCDPTPAARPIVADRPGATASAAGGPADARTSGALRRAPSSRLACLIRHWTWTDAARAQFERELAGGWDYDEDPLADRPFGAYYHWCALLCGLGEAALEEGLLPEWRFEPLRRDLDASLTGLRACRQRLVTIPASMEDDPRIVDLVRDGEALDRLRRIHDALGDAVREEQMLRDLEWLLYEH